MTTYTIGRIYCIEYIENPNVRYVGSTFQSLDKRYARHRTMYNQWCADETKKCISCFPYFREYGIDNFRIVLIKEYDVIDRKHLVSKEQLWMNKLRNINIMAAFQICADQ